eukprot:CAMPEP_0196822368 /NCGR_PEP_ID=MMETSP1362-20130617/83189_1 /TAXON_ID=163516 /ORGANISM="Leptocylindrus danicus, Strain CCMP1856" /LENGTH=41 /DNA_ID= /DNA_START= /DNA_END= /DNA_ORIENTATION=
MVVVRMQAGNRSGESSWSSVFAVVMEQRPVKGSRQHAHVDV